MSAFKRPETMWRFMTSGNMKFYVKRLECKENVLGLFVIDTALLRSDRLCKAATFR